MVVRQAAALIGAGVVIGSLAALALGATGLIASFVPARQATKVDPLVALRAE